MSSHRERAERVERFVDARVRALQGAYRAGTSGGVSDLARLRRGVGKEVGADLDLVGLALSLPRPIDPPVELLDRDPGDTGEPVPEERAVFAAVTLYALHQQSRREASMHREGHSLGHSVRLLQYRVESGSLRRRFGALGTAGTWDETVYHARSLVQQLRQHAIPLDYGRLARDLYELQTGRGDAVRLRWGRDFARRAAEDATVEGAVEENTTEQAG